jgi:hypothetical protein
VTNTTNPSSINIFDARPCAATNNFPLNCAMLAIYFSISTPFNPVLVPIRSKPRRPSGCWPIRSNSQCLPLTGNRVRSSSKKLLPGLVLLVASPRTVLHGISGTSLARAPLQNSNSSPLHQSTCPSIESIFKPYVHKSNPHCIGPLLFHHTVNLIQTTLFARPFCHRTWMVASRLDGTPGLL